MSSVLLLFWTLQTSSQGMLIKIGNNADYISRQSKCHKNLHSQLVKQCLPAEAVLRAMNYPTTLRKPNEADANLLLRHGYEVADCTYRCYNDNQNH